MSQKSYDRTIDKNDKGETDFRVIETQKPNFFLATIIKCLIKQEKEL